MSEETPLECLSRLGTSGVLWAQEFNKTAIRLGYSEMDEEWLAGWFANAIENCDVIRCNPLRAENEKLRLELDMQTATILVPSQKDDQRRIERLDAALKEALDEAAIIRAQIESAEQAYVRLDASMNRLKAAFRVNMLRAFPHMSHDEIDAEIETAIKETGNEL